jgi:hypothetical protein
MSRSTLRAALLTTLLLISGSGADAYEIELVANWDPTLACTPSTCIHNVTPTVEVWLDTEGEADIAALFFGVSFSDDAMSYNAASSSFASYLLYTGSKAPYLVPASGCCTLFPGTTDLISIGFVSTALSSGVPGAGREKMGTLVFDAVAPGGLALIDGVFDPLLGGSLLLGDGTEPPLSFTVSYAPEPATGALVGLGLAVMAGARRRRRSARASDDEPV